MSIKVKIDEKGLYQVTGVPGTPSTLEINGVDVSGGGGGGSFPLDPVPTEDSLVVTDVDGNPTTVTGVTTNGVGLAISATYNQGLSIAGPSGLGINISGASNGGIDISGNNNYGIDISGDNNYGIRLSGDYNVGIVISGADNQGIQINTSYSGEALRVDGVDMIAKINAVSNPELGAIFAVSKNLAAVDAGKIFSCVAAINPIVINIPDTLFDSDNSLGFLCSFRVDSIAAGSVTFAGTGDMVITYHGSDPGVTPLAAGDFVRLVVTSGNSADVFVDVAL